ncbi:hypothetical protein EDD29_0586 [Actinocorallia herbida]|uniref:Uncharacterized protein n=1 Tax=Actinocorallia herbida TaxID=58109 RepID=A0A3N1CP48_9ACTN|nr:hypothetical protein [Actinocorallia herbida]ROO83096.1 hypothetical protein EDD29_0586 [Actinocorallia herbida]
MQRLEFRMEPGQRKMYLILAGAYVIIGLLQFTVSAPGLGVLFLILAGVFVFYYFQFAKYGLTLTPQGITMNGWQTRAHAWSEVAAVESGKFWFADRVTLRLTDGTKRRAWAPVNAAGMRDPQFPLKVQGIQQWHAQFAGVAPQPQQGAPGPQGLPGRQPQYGQPQHAFGQQFGQPAQPQPAQPQQGQYGGPQVPPQGQQPPYGQPAPQQQPAGDWTQVFGVGGQQNPDDRR